jgi:uncharacterized membrane protein YhaH (DUF805 family)
MDWYLAVLRNYTGFNGRAHRTEYWMFTLVNAIIILALEVGATRSGTVGTVQLLYELCVLLPGLAVGMRRLHDINRSGWWILMGLIPILGWIALIYWYCRPGDVGPNDYGPDPWDSTVTSPVY